MTLRRILAAAALLTLADATPAIAGTLEQRSFPSPALGRDVPAVVYAPDHADGRLPVLYLLHGYGGGQHDWTHAGVAATADAVFAEPGAVPMLIVMPGVGNSWYVESQRHGNWDRAIARDLTAAVDAMVQGRVGLKAARHLCTEDSTGSSSCSMPMMPFRGVLHVCVIRGVRKWEVCRVHSFQDP